MESDAVGQLVAAAQANAPWAFARLYRHFSAAVCGYLRAQGAEDPEGLTNEVFLGAFRRLGAFTGDGDGFRSWLFTIAHHRLVDDRRRRARTLATAPLDRSVDPRAGGDVEDDALARLAGGEAMALLDGLPPDQRAVLTLRVVADLSIAETAGILGKQPGAVKSLQHRALEALRRKLSHEGVSA
ncbi:MAG TPA: RNA polymerase sigma factor [Egibacteraceae bacterium]|nr:RNA polymerase sigma factor [Egibacteraceae bacterium]